MKEFIFNHKYFDKEFMTDEKIEDKIQSISDKANTGVESFRSKRLGKREFQDDDYENIKSKVDGLLILNTKKLIGKLLLRVNLDFQPNEKFVLFIVLCNYNYKNPCFSFESLLSQLLEPVIEKKVKKYSMNVKLK